VGTSYSRKRSSESDFDSGALPVLACSQRTRGTVRGKIRP
jgi:hypothetical protein